MYNTSIAVIKILKKTHLLDFNIFIVKFCPFDPNYFLIEKLNKNKFIKYIILLIYYKEKYN